MKYLKYGSAAAGLGFSAYLVLNTLRLKAPAAGKKRSFADGEKRMRDYAEKLSDMVKIPTVTGRSEEFDRLQELMKAQFPKVFEMAEIKHFGKSLLIRAVSENPALPPIILMGHQDVVPAEGEGWSCPPFSGEIAEGKVWGRGAFDCKATVFCELSALEEILEAGKTLKRDVYIAMSENEETGGGGAPAIVDYLAEKGIAPAIVLDEGAVIVDEGIPGMDRSFAPIGVMEKGIMNIKFTAHSKGGHASQPPKNTPLARLADFVSEVEHERPFNRKIDPVVGAALKGIAPILPFGMRLLFGNVEVFKPLLNRLLPSLSPMLDAWLGTTVCFTMCNGAEAYNAIPSEAYVIANLRLSPMQGKEESFEILRRIAEKHGVEAELISGYDATSTADMKGESYKRLCSALKSSYPDIAMGPYLLTGGTDCRHFERLCPNTYRITPLRVNAQQNEAVHGINENISIDTLVETVEFYKTLIFEFDS